MTYKTEIEAAVAYLIGKGIIRRDADVINALEMSKGTFSAYKNGKTEPSENFVNKFENFYKLKLSDFKIDSKADALQYQQQRLNQKLAGGPFMVPFFPVKAQAGYTKASDQAIFVNTLERFAMPPGIDPYGAEWRYYEVAGDSMENTFFPGDILLTSLIPPMDWDNLRNFYVYVVITEDLVTVKRVARHPDDPNDFVLISDNYENYKQTRIPIRDVKELWVYRRTFKMDARPPIVFKIDV